MNIVIPLCGYGKRFKNFTSIPKPLIKVFNKEIIKYTLDCIGRERKIYLIYPKHLSFCKVLKKYKNITHIVTEDYTIGPVETIQIAIQHIDNFNPCLIMDGDGFYNINIFKNLANIGKNSVVFYKNNYKSNDELYSNIIIDDTKTILDIDEKKNISCNINTGAYYFESKKLLENYCQKILNDCKKKSIEPYTSYLIKEMINDGHLFKGFEINQHEFVSLGTPEQIMEYKNYFKQNFLFDLDGTIVKTDKLYFQIWKQILQLYGKNLDYEIYNEYIFGKDDNQVCKNLLNVVDEEEKLKISKQKDEMFLQNINQIKQVENSINFIKFLKKRGAHVCIVSNCNSFVAKEILKHFHLNVPLIIGNECTRPKPFPDPYEKALENRKNFKTVIFEDSTTGLNSAKAVSPDCIVGISTHLSKEELENSGANVVISKFSNYIFKFQYNNITNIQDNVSTILGKSIKIQPLKLKGGFIADVYKGDDVIFKMNNNEKNIFTNIVEYLELYKREKYFYTKMYKDISCIINVPKYYGIVEKSFCKGLILENLYMRKFSIHQEPTLERCNNIIDEISKLHLSYWNKDLYIKEKFPVIADNKNINNFIKKFMVENIDKFLKKWQHMTTIKVVEKCKTAIINIDNLTSSNNTTICHGDVKMANIFFDKDIPYFIDWQYVKQGKGVEDLVFFLIESFDLDQIKQFKEYLVSRYFNNVKHVYSRNDFDKDYEAAIWFYPFFVAIWFGTLKCENLLDTAFPETYITRFFNFVHSF